MESTLSFLDCSIHTTPHDVQIRIVRQFEIVNTSHDARQVIIGGVGWLARFAHNRKHRGKCLKTFHFQLAMTDVQDYKFQLTANWKLRATSGELQEISSLW
jgi:hypothetical protein